MKRIFIVVGMSLSTVAGILYNNANAACAICDDGEVDGVCVASPLDPLTRYCYDSGSSTRRCNKTASTWGCTSISPDN